MFIEHSRYVQLHEMLENNVRYTGSLLIFTLGGFIYISLKNDKSFGEWFLLFLLICFAPLMWIRTYAFWFTTLFSCLLIGMSLTNIVYIKNNKKRKIMCIVLITNLLLAVSFSGFYQHWRTYKGEKSPSGNWFMSEKTYKGALWIKDNIDKNRRMVGNDFLVEKRVFAISGVPTLTDAAEITMFIYGFASLNNTPIVRNSPFSISFYRDNPFVIASNYTRVGYVRSALRHFEVDSISGKSIISRFNLSYVVENQKVKDVFTRSLQKVNNIYDNGGIRVWNLV